MLITNVNEYEVYVCTLDFDRLVSWWALTLCLVILRPSRNILLHGENSVGRVSLSLF
jgi:hypothetical protein